MKLVHVVVFVLGLSACRKSEIEDGLDKVVPTKPKVDPATAKANTEKLVATMSAFADEMCACKDKPCADEVQARYVKASEAAPIGSASFEADDATKTRVAELGARFGECMAKAAAGEGSSAQPPATP